MCNKSVAYFSRVSPRYIPSTLFANPAMVAMVELLVAVPATDTILETKSSSLSALKESWMLVRFTLQFILKDVNLSKALDEEYLPKAPLPSLMVRSVSATLHWKGTGRMHGAGGQN